MTFILNHLSPLQGYFLIIAEVLAIQLRNNDCNIQGIEVNEIMKLFGQYADDADLYLLGNAESITNMFKILDNFCRCTGFKINCNKTTLYQFGSIIKSNAEMYTNEKVQWAKESINILRVDIIKDQSQICQLNYRELIVKSKAICNSWQNRNISLIGKVLIINTLIASLFVYKMSVLPIIPVNVCKQMDQMICEFIWNGKKPKIPMEILQKNKDDGGLGLVNFRLKDQSLKANWVKVLFTDAYLKELAFQKLCPYIREQIFDCNIKSSDTHIFGQSFWTDVLKSWSYINFKSMDGISTVEEICDQLIWYNTHIRIANQIVFMKEAWASGLIYVGQLFDVSKGTLKSVNTICQQFNLSCMQANAIIVSLPQKWKRLVLAKFIDGAVLDTTPNNATRLRVLVQSNKHLCQYYYKKVNENVRSLFDRYNKWGTMLESMDIDMDDFCQAFKNIYKVTNVIKYCSFQYRLLHKAIILNDRLYHWKVVKSNSCSFCSQQKEDISHFFWSCSVTQSFWKFAKKLVEKRFPDNYVWNGRSILLNLVHPVPNHVANFIILVGKQYLYRCRCIKESINFFTFENLIHKCQMYEKSEAQKQNKYPKHCKKWFIEHSNEVE